MFVDNFNILFNLLPKLENKKIVIFGASKGGQRVYFELKFFEQKPTYFVDNDPNTWGNTLLGKKICSPQELLKEDKDNITIVIASIYEKEISKQLVEMGFEKNKHFFSKEVNEYTGHRPNSSIQFPYSIGKYTYGHMFLNPNIDALIEKIGAFCSIAVGARIGIDNHTMETISSHNFLRDPLFGHFLENYRGDLINHKNNKKVVIGNDVWIGTNAIILPNVTIGNGAVIGAGAIVTKNVPDYAIVVGVPAKILRYRFKPKEIELLNKIKWWDWPDEKIKENINLFYDKKAFFEYARKSLQISEMVACTQELDQQKLNNKLPL